MNKATNPSTDTGTFDLQIDGTTYGSNQGNGGTTGAVPLTAGSHTVGELGFGATVLADYAASFSGDCASDGTVTLGLGDDKVCTITNTKKPKLTVNKVTDPTTDTGLFNLQIDGATAGTGANQGNGGSTGAVTLDVISQPDAIAAFSDTLATGQSFTATTTGFVTEIDVRSRTATSSATLYMYNGNDGSGTPGSVGSPDYTQTGVSLTDAGGDSSAFGFSQIVLTTPFAVTAGSQYSFVIQGAGISGTNTNPYPGGTKLDDYAGISASQDIAFQVVSTHTVGETAGTGTTLSDYTAVISGACAADGTISLRPGDNATCTITNKRRPKLTVIKHVVNDDGGLKAASDFSITVTGTNVQPSATFAGADAPGTTVTLDPGSYSVDEAADSGYTKTLGAGCSGTLAYGDEATCTITNDDKPGTLTVIKHVINDNGGSASASDFSMTVTGTNVQPSATFAGAESPGTTVTLNAGSYSVDEAANSAYTKSIGSDCSGTIANGETKSCTITNDDKPGTLIVIKHVINDNGGSKTAADFSMTVTGGNVQPGATFAGAESPGTTVTLNAGSYGVDEAADSGYTKSLGSDCSGSIANGETKTCTITNDDKPGTLTVIKHVINDNGGAKTAADFSMMVTGANVQPGATFPGAESPGTTVTLNAGSYSVDEAADSGYTKSIGSDCSGSIANGETKSCTITNDDKPGTLVVKKHVINDNGGTSTAGDFSLTVTGTNVQPGATFPGSESGTTVTLDAGSYSVDEAAFFGYAKTVGANCSGSVANGETKNCTITNDDIQPTITIFKSLSPATDPGRFNLNIDATTYKANAGNGDTTGVVGINAGSHSVNESNGTVPPTDVANYTSSVNCGAFGSGSGTSLSIAIGVGQNAVCTITNTVNDADGDGIPDFLDCSPTVPENRVVDPNNVLAAYPSVLRYPTLQAAVTAAGDDEVISMYGNTTENVVVGGGKDLRIIGCGHKVTASVTTNPVITVDSTAGAANDAANAFGAETDIQIEDISVLHGSIGFLIQTTKPVSTGLGTTTLLKSVRSDTNGPNNGSGNPTVSNPGHAIKIEGDGNEVRGANSLGTNSGDGINVTGNNNTLKTNKIQSNKGDGIDVTGSSTLINGNSVGEKSVGNKMNGILVNGASNTITENDVFGNTKTGINVTGGLNVVYKNDVGDKGKGNGSGGILVTGTANTLGSSVTENDLFGNTGGPALSVVGDFNDVSKNNVGDSGKGNTGVGINVKGKGNTVDQNNVFANTGDGIATQGSASGTTMVGVPPAPMSNQNQITSNTIGDKGKGNGGDGLSAGVAADAGNIIHDNTIFANSKIGMNLAGSSGQIYGNSVGERDKGNGTGGITLSGSSNVVGTGSSPNLIYGNTGIGLKVTGDANVVFNNNVGDKDKGNTGNGIDLTGKGNTVDQNIIYANGKNSTGDGINAAGGTAASPNVISNNTVGDNGKGNLGNGIVVSGTGNGTSNPIEISSNSARGNKLNGIKVSGTGHQLANNISGGNNSGLDNGDCEYTVVANNFNAGGNRPTARSSRARSTRRSRPAARALHRAFDSAGGASPRPLCFDFGGSGRRRAGASPPLFFCRHTCRLQSVRPGLTMSVSMTMHTRTLLP